MELQPPWRCVESNAPFFTYRFDEFTVVVEDPSPATQWDYHVSLSAQGRKLTDDEVASVMKELGCTFQYEHPSVANPHVRHFFGTHVVVTV